MIHQDCTRALEMRLENLKVEYLTNPIGLDERKPRFFWNYSIDDETKRNEEQFSYRIMVSENISAIQKNLGTSWDSGKVVARKSIHIEYDGKPLESNTKYYWKVITEDNNGIIHDSMYEWGETWWHTGLLGENEWGAKWMEAPSPEPTEMMVVDTTKGLQKIKRTPPVPMFRKQFNCDIKIKSAILYATALGEYQVHINKNRVGERYLAPEWTDYNKRLLYQAYDVTEYLEDGENTIGVLVGDGWYMGLLGPGDQVRQLYYGDKRKIICQLIITYEDGNIEMVCSDESWRVHVDGPIRLADHFLGCEFDSRKEQDGWDGNDFDDSEWNDVIISNTPNVKIQAQRHEPVRIIKKIEPIAINKKGPETYIVDFGQNIVGWCNIFLDGVEGQEIIVRHGEMLELDGNLHVDNLRLAAQTDTYILNGKGKRSFNPYFTFHGFRYAEISGVSHSIDKNTIIAIAISSNSTPTGEFECSNQMLNKLWENIWWTQRDNMISIPTDCPQRNERMGWTGDAQVFAQTGIYNLDLVSFFNKFIIDLRDGQGEEGMYPDFAPHPFQEFQFSFGPGWGDAGIIIPWRVYTCYGDKRMLGEHYPSMKAFIDLVIEENPSFLWNVWGSNYGDWLHGDTIKADGYPSEGGELPKDVYATLFFYISTKLIHKVALVLGKEDDAKFYENVKNEIQDAFIEAYVSTEGKIKGDTQSAYAMALGFGILPDKYQDRALEYLIDALNEYDGRISTGFISTIQMMLELSSRGKNDLAYSLVETTRFPSWGYTIEQGATTIWERWDGFVKGRGFQDKGMNSFNHYSIGAIGEWLYRVVLGINFDENNPAMEHIIINARPGGTLEWANGSYASINGKICTKWNKEDVNSSIEIQIPPNTKATVYLDGRKEEVGSGKYNFSIN